ncbi:restriction endonuclease subunit S [Trueperella pecoris]|uniref:Restriction endonuclease subunit S n=1 Tax=Trueperella pecoris TaxID=2733571 RepID=A0A7M1R1L2_9ACTO|nr:restriction endonuclease subunit S [Trueperella pecoris]QOR47317.1 restriction endonuclease subunit S [Trueperella pecoris]
MSHIQDLIDELCPNGGVPHQPLSKVASFTRGGGPQKKDFRENGELCLHYGQIYTRFGVSTSKVVSYIDPEVFTRSRKAYPGDVIIADTSENDADLAKAVAWLGDGPIAVSNHTLIAHTSLDPLYLSYFLRSSLFQRQKQKYISGTKVRTISADGLGKVRIPVPPLEVQRGIVRILDGFTKLEAELEAELEARRKQYAFYRDQLLTFTPEGGRTKWLPLGELVKVVAGCGFPKRYQGRDSLPFPFYKVSDMNLPGNEITLGLANNYVNEVDLISLKARTAPAGTIVFPKIGAAIGTNKKRILTMDSVFDNNIVGLTVFNPALDHKFLFHWFQTVDLIRLANDSGAVPSIRSSELKKLKIPVPPLEEQRRIVTILDKFDALVNDISSGLPAEIEARRKQYEHYRDRLLTFPELNG